jgi:hypothetical protein
MELKIQDVTVRVRKVLHIGDKEIELNKMTETDREIAREFATLLKKYEKLLSDFEDTMHEIIYEKHGLPSYVFVEKFELAVSVCVDGRLEEEGGEGKEEEGEGGSGGEVTCIYISSGP